MYHGNNPTAVASQRLLLNSLMKLMKEKEFKDISVSELCNLSSVSRQTFYTLFGKKENILIYQLEMSNNTKPNDESNHHIDLKEICKNFAKYVSSNFDYLKMLINNDLVEIIYMYYYYTISSCKQSFIDLNNDEKEYASQFMASGLCRLTQTYVEKHEKANSKELNRLSYKLLSGNIYKNDKS